MYELIGVLASIIVLLSFVMNGESRIRVINIVGALLFVIYGLLINAFSVWFLNGTLLLVHIYKLIKLKRFK